MVRSRLARGPRSPGPRRAVPPAARPRLAQPARSSVQTSARMPASIRSPRRFSSGGRYPTRARPRCQRSGWPGVPLWSASGHSLSRPRSDPVSTGATRHGGPSWKRANSSPCSSRVGSPRTARPALRHRFRHRARARLALPRASRRPRATWRASWSTRSCGATSRPRARSARPRRTPIARVFGEGLRWRNIALEDLNEVLNTGRQEALDGAPPRPLVHRHDRLPRAVHRPLRHGGRHHAVVPRRSGSPATPASTSWPAASPRR